MDQMGERASEQPLFSFLPGGGEMGGRIRAFDWSQTPLGPAANWPQSLKTALRIILASRYPMFVWWGTTVTNLYNDAYISMLGKRHPEALGQCAADVWADVWPIVGPQVDVVLKEGRATWNEEALLLMERNQFLEEAYFTFSYSPLPNDEGDIGGLFCAVTEETQRVLSQRRLRTLRELAEQATQARTAGDACQIAAATLAENPHDLPFALLYLLDNAGQWAKLAGLTGLEQGTTVAPDTVELADDNALWPFRQVAETGTDIVIHDLPRRFGPLPGGAWPESPQQAIVLPMTRPGQSQLAGFVVAGVSPRLAFSDDYRTFMELLAGHVATAVANARAYEEERWRAEKLAELDRAKTVFFSNVSHEFRTPLTLMLGPLEDMLAKGNLGPATRNQLEVVHRNSLRLLKLVNTLLDFSRIEAGRLQAHYEPLDLARYTAELASVFRAAIERAGLRLIVHCPPLPELVYVDRDMWEKIVLNLLSNAFKFTFAGEIELRLESGDGQVQLIVRDTGVGIPAEELPRIFERFHRVKESRGRTDEGSGIGLALVQELVELHGGTVQVESVLNEGSCFLVALPLGKAHLNPERIGGRAELTPTITGADMFVQEALRWLPGQAEEATQEGDEETRGQGNKGQEQDGEWRWLAASDSLVERLAGEEENGPPSAERARILWADDNADMRAYVSRLLGERYEVEAVADGQAALEAARANRPTLVISDVMMPKLDGFGLLQALRQEPALQHVPVILLSARAGEEARIEGIARGADDYLIKPFSARELLARVESQIRTARLQVQLSAELAERKRAEERLQKMNEELEQRVAQRTHELERRNERLRQLAHQLSEAEQWERRRLAKTLHDGLQQLLIAGKLQLRLLLSGSSTEAAEDLQQLLDEAIEVSRSLTYELSPPVLSTSNLPGALEWLVHWFLNNYRFTVELRVDETFPAVPDHMKMFLFDAVRELLFNSVKHSESAAATVELIRPQSQQLRITVADDGQGFEPGEAEQDGSARQGFGLFSIRERLAALGGEFHINSTPGAGARFVLTVPFAEEEEQHPGH